MLVKLFLVVYTAGFVSYVSGPVPSETGEDHKNCVIKATEINQRAMNNKFDIKARCEYHIGRPQLTGIFEGSRDIYAQK